MNLYMISYDGRSQMFYVEAANFTDAIALWHAHVKVLWADDYDGTEQPEQVVLVHDEGVIREYTEVKYTPHESELKALIASSEQALAIIETLHPEPCLDSSEGYRCGGCGSDKKCPRCDLKDSIQKANFALMPF